MSYSSTSHSECSTTTRTFIYHIRHCYSHKICYIIIWHVLSKSLYMYTYRDAEIMEMDSATGRLYIYDPWVDRHHLVIRNRQSLFPSSSPHVPLPTIPKSVQFVEFIMASDHFRSTHPLPTLLLPELLFFTNSLLMPCEV
jgi:hypothetical protein